MKDLKTLMPHHRDEPKLERWKTLSIINEIGEMKHCNKAMFFEGRHKQDLYMWLSNLNDGPSAKFLVENISTMGELKLTGNCLKGARPMLSFDQNFSKIPHLMLLRELLTQIFGIPNHHPKSQPFVDRVYTFTFLDNRIWFRNYQILAEDGALAEIGPRFVMNPVKIFGESFTGEAIWENPDYVTPAKHRRMLKLTAKDKYVNRTTAKAQYDATMPTQSYNIDKVGQEVFVNDEEEMAQKIVEEDENEPETASEEEAELQAKRELINIKNVKKLIEKLKPGKEGKKLVKPKKLPIDPKTGKITKKSSNTKRSKMIQNIAKTKKLGGVRDKPKKLKSNS